MASQVPKRRIAACNSAPLEPTGEYVLYWMIASRRTGWNFGLERAAEWARELGKPLVVLEALRCDYRWACDRLHHFAIQGMAANARRLERTRAAYYPYVERRPGEGRGLLRALARRASVVVTDDYPCFFLPRMVAAAAEQLAVRLEKVDSNGLIPLRAAERVYGRAVDFRRFLQKTLAQHLDDFPRRNPLARAAFPVLGRLPGSVIRRWPVADVEALAAAPGALAELPIDHSVPPVVYDGGSEAARKGLRRFLDRRLARYAEARNDVGERATSELSPYLHFGHLSVHEIFVALVERERWDPSRLLPKATASKHGWWGMSESL